ncbi:hypothetical protein GOBAR_AA39267 [Gossypium barbadense]|uniref:Uncharacterized protein n=1 Tax=Gossypium barbadense TaxID=3634 RepID=A0A2P5VRK7_GOSBA|nr:hypothetical protein GOBAR_AA39267 [Gossypium barbadense]
MITNDMHFHLQEQKEGYWWWKWRALAKGKNTSPSMSLFKEVRNLWPKWCRCGFEGKVESVGCWVGAYPVHLQSTLLSPSHSFCMKVPAPKIMSLLSPMVFSISSFDVVSTK